MSDCPIEELPKNLIYYTATEISRRGQTRFDINTHFFNPTINRSIQLKLPIESIILYDYLTPIVDSEPKELFFHTLERVNFTAFKTITLLGDEHKKRDKGRICFEFDYYSKVLNKNLIIQIPKLILARDLFFSHPYLLRAALFAENYSTDILVDTNDEKAIHITIAQNKKILSADISDPHFLKKLALILLQPDLNKAFLSIYQKTIIDQKGAKSFNFDMEVPDLKNIDLTVDGIYDKKTGIYRIERITSFKNLDTAINRPIQFHFTSKKIIQQVKNAQGQGSNKPKPASQPKEKLNKNADADIDQRLIKLRNLPAEIYTIEDLKISLETPPTKTTVRKKILKKMDENKNQDEGFAGGEGDIEGTIPGFTIESDTQLERITHKDLIKVLDQIEKKGYDVKEIKNSPFKKYKLFRGHKFSNGNQLRYFYVYRIINTKNDEQFYLCEIDTSDGKKNISTLLLRYEEKTQLLIETDLEKLNNSILSQSLSWPKKFLSEIRGITAFTTINHPSKQKQLEDVNYYADWAQRILAKVKSI
ncbi:Tn7-like element transposition protein TnsE [Acinetobacter sp. YH12111]|uniref:Tn7-like element transposition protein TnsE n=1 Tax=Acinetobacter sp. YH12111 TaxID=2601098 RepID=UPI0015D222D7|nr:Tn7-like element transposition protein TnsE [Acinetobacter sp. YH12111]